MNVNVHPDREIPWASPSQLASMVICTLDGVGSTKAWLRKFKPDQQGAVRLKHRKDPGSSQEAPLGRIGQIVTDAGFTDEQQHNAVLRELCDDGFLGQHFSSMIQKFAADDHGNNGDGKRSHLHIDNALRILSDLRWKSSKGRRKARSCHVWSDKLLEIAASMPTATTPEELASNALRALADAWSTSTSRSRNWTRTTI